jgi:predicted Rossmann fold nucleotide-binding protein DprA/Smf involved in DNA uptake
MVESAADIFEEFPWLVQKKNFQGKLESSEPREYIKDSYQQLLSAMGEEPVLKESLVERMKSDPGRAAHDLLAMELQGLIKLLPGGWVQKL